MAKKKPETTTGVENIEQTLSRAEQFIDKNQKILSVIVIGIIVIVGGYIGYKKLYLNPRQEKALVEMFKAEAYFEKDSFNLALEGDGNYDGFLYIIDEYGSTKAGKLANYYAGICYLRLGQFQEAIDYLDNFSSDDVMVGTVAIGATGDAYMELGDTETAIEKYLEAADNNPNDFTTPIYLMKAGRACEILGDYTRALQIYERIDADFKDTQEGRFIEKYITQAKLRIK